MPGRRRCRRRRRLADLGAAQHVLELADPGLELALLVLGGVVAAVLLEVALVAGGAIRSMISWRTGPLEVSSSACELVVGLLGQPDRVVVGCVMGAPASSVLAGAGSSGAGEPQQLHGPSRPVGRLPARRLVRRAVQPSGPSRSKHRVGNARIRTRPPGSARLVLARGGAADQLDAGGPPLGADLDLVAARRPGRRTSSPTTVWSSAERPAAGSGPPPPSSERDVQPWRSRRARRRRRSRPAPS